MSKLFIVPTPIGNLQDMTFRAIDTLKNVDFVCAEDTRVSGRLFQHYEISKQLIPFHQHNEHKVTDRLVERIQMGETAALVSDAGTPAISDPGFMLVRACVHAGIEVETLPGATAFVPALVNSGFPCEKFVYEGFLPHKKGRQTRVQKIAKEERTVVLYESPHRLIKALTQFQEFFEPNRQISISREISKKFEETIRGTAEELIEYFNNKSIKGEFVIVIHGKL